MTQMDGSEMVLAFCALRPLAVGVLRRHGIDPSSRTTVAACCESRGLTVEAFRAELVACEEQLAAAWRGRALPELLDHIVRTFHRPFSAKLGEVTAMLDEARPDGEPARTAWCEVSDQLAELRLDLEDHMLKEEQVLFPWLRRRAVTAAAPIRAMQLEHGDAISLLLALHVAAARWGDAASDPSARLVIAKLVEVEDWVCEHIHFESNELVPRALDPT